MILKICGFLLIHCEKWFVYSPFYDGPVMEISLYLNVLV